MIALGEDELRNRGSMSWCGAQDVAARAYGEDWKTLGLCDRGYWDEANTRLFPNTCRLLRASRSVPVPCSPPPPHHHQRDQGCAGGEGDWGRRFLRRGHLGLGGISTALRFLNFG